jgi:tetratricopeptide (TPR) repeat protein
MGVKLDEEIDRGWFDAELTGAGQGDSVEWSPPERAEGLGDDDWGHLVETLQSYEREVAATVDPRRRAEICYEVGRLYETRAADDRRAVQYYQRAVRCDPKHFPSLRAGRGVFSRFGRWQMVAALLDAELKATQSPEGRAALLVEKGDLHWHCFEDLSGARTCYARALELEPGHRGAARALRRLAAVDGDPGAVAEALERSAAVSEDANLQAWMLADAAAYRITQGAREDARRDLDLALQLSPGNDQARSLLADSLRAAGEWDALMALWSRSAAESTGVVRAERYTQLARLALEGQEDLVGAVAFLEQAVAADPGATVALHMLLELQERSGAWEAVAQLLRRLANSTRDHVTRIRLLSRLADVQLKQLSDEDGAVVTFHEVLEIDPTWVPALQQLGRLLIRRGDWRSLVAMHTAELSRIEATAARAAKLFKLGEIYETRLGDRDGALRAYRQAVELDPDFLHAVKALDRVLSAAGEWWSVVELLEGTADRVGDDTVRVGLYVRVADIQENRLSEPVLAMEAWQRVLSVRPDHSDAMRALARLYGQHGMWREVVQVREAEARATLDEAVALSLILGNAEICEHDLGDLDRAASYYRWALDLNAGDRTAQLGLGRVYQSQGAWTALIDLYLSEAEGGAESQEEVATLHFRIAEIQRDHLDEPERAIGSLEAALGAVPGHLPSLRALQRLCATRGNLEREAELVAQEAELVPDPREQAALYFRLGELYRRTLKQLELAAEAYEKVLVVQSDFLPALQALVEVYESIGNAHELTGAWRRLAQSTRTDAEAVRAWLTVGRLSAQRLGADVDAIEAYESVLAVQADHVGAMLALERLYLRTGAYEELEGLWRRLADIATEPGERADLLYQRARLTDERLNRPAEAMQGFLEVLALTPEKRQAAERLEAVARGLGDDETVILALSHRAEWARTDSERIHILLRRADALRRMGDPDTALASYEAVLALDARCLPAMRGARELHENAGRTDKALEMAGREGRLVADPRSAAELLLRVARVREQREDIDGALGDYADALKQNPESDEAADGVRRLCERTGRWNVLATLLRNRAAGVPDRSGPILLEVAEITLQRLGDVDGAVRLLNQLVQEVPDLAPEVLQRLADLYVEQENWSEAAVVYEQLRDSTPDLELRRAVTFRLATIYRDKLADNASARACLDDVLDGTPDHPEALLRRAAIAEDEGEPRDAIALWRRALPGLADHRRGPVMSGIARLLEAEGDAGEAIDAYRQALAVHPEDVPTFLRLGGLLARLHDRDGLLEAALPVLEALGAHRPEDAMMVRRWLGGVCLRDLDAPDDARVILREAVAVDPDDHEAHALYAEALDAGTPDVERAVEERLWLLRRSPFDVDQLRRLHRDCVELGDLDRAFHVAVLLSCLDAAEAEENATIRRVHAMMPRWPRRGLTPAMRARLRSEHEPEWLARFLDAARPALPRLFRAAPRTQSREAVSSDLMNLGRKVAEGVGIPRIAIEVDRSLGDIIAYTDREPVAVVFGAGAVSGLAAGEQAFHLGRGAELGRRHLAQAAQWSPAAFLGVLETVALANDLRITPRVVDAAEAGRRAEKLMGTLGSREAAILADASAALEEHLDGLDPERALQGIRETADRVGLLVAGGLMPAMGVLRRAAQDGPRPQSPEGWSKAYANAPGASALAAWTLGDDYYALRRDLGLNADD